MPRCAEVRWTLLLNTRIMGVLTGIGPPCTLVAISVGVVVVLTIIGGGVSSSPQPNRHNQIPMKDNTGTCIRDSLQYSLYLRFADIANLFFRSLRLGLRQLGLTSIG